MAPSQPQPDHAAPIMQEFLEWVPKYCIDGTNGPSATPNSPFMPLPDLESYLKAERRTNKLLRALFPEREPRVIPETLELFHIRVFTILILIGKGRFIEYVVQHHNLRDSHLPFLEKPMHFPTDPNDPKFWNSFYEMQFAFCAHIFRNNENDAKLEDRSILPIISKEAFATGGSAAIYKIQLHSHYDRLNPAVDASQASGARPANIYVLKTYNTKEADLYYCTEVDAFKKLKSATKHEIDESLIQFLGSYRQGDSYNILLEYADRGTLEDFFKSVEPPSLGEDIVTFWSRLFNVLKALSRIHATERPDGFLGPDILIGWHQDVKPSNILVLSGKSNNPYDVQFKLADLGLSHFKRTAKLDRRIADGDIGGTKDYGAPECDRSNEFLEQTKLNVRPSIDIWSFGAVCSEAAVWVVLGWQRLIEYRSQRKHEIYNKGSSQDGSCFHDGENVLKTVESMHDRLLRKGEIRPRDYVTGPVLDQMVTSMLEEDPDGRQNAIWLGKRSQKILREAQQRLEESAQQVPPKQERSTNQKDQFLQWSMPDTPPRTSHGAAQPYNGSLLPHGPPPNDPKYSSHAPLPERSSSARQRLNKRSETWQDRSNTPEMAPGPVYGYSSPSVTFHQPIQSSPPSAMYLDPQEYAEPQSAASDEGAFVFEEKPLPNFDPLSYSPPNGPRKGTNFENVSGQHQGTRDFSPPQAEFHSRIHHARHMGSDPDPALKTLRTGGAFGPPLESEPLRAKVTSVPLQHESSHLRTGTMSWATNQISPPDTPLVPPSPLVLPSADTTAAVQKDRAKIPYLSLKAAKQFREKRGVLPHNELLNDLRNRDHVFLMDDSLSMKEHWDDVISLFSIFAYIAKRLDDDGLEMYFTVSSGVEKFKDTTPAVTHLRSMRQTTYSNINIRLEHILRKYQADLEHQRERRGIFRSRPKTVKPLSLYVFTDGAWQGCDAVPPIEAMIEKQRQLGLPKEQVGIQFIRFGDDQVGIERLQYLDSGLRKKYGKRWDIVDTEPFVNGNLWKMLLGAVFDWFDDDDPD